MLNMFRGIFGRNNRTFLYSIQLRKLKFLLGAEIFGREQHIVASLLCDDDVCTIDMTQLLW